MTEAVRDVRVPDDTRPSPQVIAARIDLGCACYHEVNCPFALYMADESLFESAPACDCGGEEMAKAYAERPQVDREWLVEVDSYTSLVAYRYASHLPPDVVESLKRLSTDARKLYKAADVQD